MRFLVPFVVFCLCFLCSCSNSVSEWEREEQNRISPLDSFELKDMSLVRSFGKKVSIGTDNSSASLKDRPSMRVVFDYDFFIGTHEITCAEMGRPCEDLLPATRVTYFDAVLYANKRSIEEGFDTAYSYTGATFDAFGSCMNLDGLVFSPSVMAYRLPTEAEWVYAAERNWNPEKGWHNGNSGFELQNVCTSFVGEDSLCDMAGNVMEWVNDWFTPLRDTTVHNFVGAPDGGTLGERVVKGGSYRNAVGSINRYSRGDIYTVTSASQSDYVGFRLAFGAIESPVWLGKDGKQVNSVVSVLAGAMDIRRWAGTFKAKLAFRNDETGNLAFVDYTQGGSVVTEIEDTLNVYHPDISPDGNWVAFCTGLEGVRGKSSVYVRSLDSIGSGLVKLDVENAAIPRWRVLESGDTVIVYVTDAGNNKDESVFKQASTWQVRFSKGKFGTPEKLFGGAYHGGVSDGNSFAVSGARLLRARVAGVDTVWYNGEQACNASLSKDNSKQTLFLDFASRTGTDFVGKSYGAHEVAFVADSAGRLVRYVMAPEGYAFDHTEWMQGTNHMFVASLSDANGRHARIAMVDSYSGKSVVLLEGEEIWHPAFWALPMDVSGESSLNPDSAGLYFVEGKENHVLAGKMHMFWHNHDSIEVVVFGNSRMLFGVNPMQMEDYYVFNFGTVPCDMNASYYIFSNYVLPHSPNLKFIVVGIDPDMWWIEDTEWNIDNNIKYVPGFAYDAYHGFWKEGVSDEFLQMVDNNFRADNDYNNAAPYRGWIQLIGEHGWDKDLSSTEIVNDTTDSDLSKTLDQELEMLVNLVNMAKDRGVKVLGVTAPLCPCYKKTGAYGRYGLRRSQAKEFFEKIHAYDAREDYFRFLDENKMGDHDYPLEVGFDYDHINYVGSAILTSRVYYVLRQME